MAGLEDPNTVDLVGLGADGRALMIMVESRMWGTAEAQGRQLREKINAYAGFVIDGSLARLYPETTGRPVDVQLDCIDIPNGEVAAIIEHAGRQLAKLGIGFRLNVVRGSSERGST
jgi:hypothetical protein